MTSIIGNRQHQQQFLNGNTSNNNNSANLWELKTKAVEDTLEPLINQVTILASGNASAKRKGKSKNAHMLVQELIESIELFMKHGTDIANENPDYRDDLLRAINDVRVCGEAMVQMSKEFADDPFSSAKRANMVKTARDLLAAVARLLTIADMIDSQSLLKYIQLVQKDLASIKNSSNQDELTANFKNYGQDVVDLTNQAGIKQINLKDHFLRDELAAARAVLKKNSLMLFTTSKTLIRYPELAAAQANHDSVIKEICAAIDKIHGITTNKITSEQIRHIYDQATSLAAALNEFDRQVIGISPLIFNESRMRVNLETQLENIISAVALLADSDCTRPNRRDRLVNECNSLRQALQDLLNAYVHNNNRKGGSDEIDKATNDMTSMTRNLRRQLRKAINDHVSDTFLETSLPLEDLIDAAKSGDQSRLEDCIKIFNDHTEKILEVSSMACSMSTDFEGVKIVRMAAMQVRQLTPQVINAARILCARPTSKVTLENMDVYKDAWLKNVKLLTEAVDDIISINDFLSVSENHILEDINRCVIALRDKDSDTLDRTAGAIRGRVGRICNVVTSEMDNYEPCDYTSRVLETVAQLKDQIVINFAHSVDYAYKSLTSQPIREIDENAFIDALRLVYDGVRDVRNAVLMIRDTTNEEYELSDSDIDVGEDLADSAKNIYEPNDKYEFDVQKDYNQFTAEQQEQIMQHLEKFRMEKRNFDREVLKWDDKGNDIIVLAKQMCVIMMEMTDFTRGKGPLKTTMDIINAAKKISECGTKLERLARIVADECPESQSKRDLEAYMKQLPLFCNQLNIASKVKENVIDVSGEPIITGLDSATSLIIAGKNLMNAVVSVVKASYVASTKYTSKTGNKKPIVQWRMKAPEKKPLVINAIPQDIASRVRKASQKKKVEPIRELSEFQS